MSVREAPTVNRICDLKDKDRAYRKHLDALAHAKPTIDTSAPEVPNRLKAKSRADARYRQAVVSEQAARKKMLAKATKGEAPAESEFNEDEVLKKFSEDAELFDAQDKMAEDEVTREVQQRVKIGFTEEPVIEEEVIERKTKSPAAKGKAGNRVKVVGQSRTPVKVQPRPVKKETVLTTSPVQAPEEHEEEEKQDLNATGTSLNRSMNRTAQFEDDFIDDDDEGNEGKEEEEEPVPRPKTAPRTPRASRPGTAKSTATENFEQSFEDDFEEDEIGAVPALRENVTMEKDDHDDGNFDEMPDFDLGVPELE